MCIEDIANKIVDAQHFTFENFQQARMSMLVTLFGTQYILEYDGYTTAFYGNELSDSVQRELRASIYKKLRGKFNSEQMKLWYEYQALFWFCACNKIDFQRISKETRPDFIAIADSGERVGIEVTKLTSPIDEKRLSVQRMTESKSFAEGKKVAKQFLGKDASRFDAFPMGSSWTLFPREATCLSDQRQFHAMQFRKKYEKYFVSRTDGMYFDEFIILGNALHNIIAITNDEKADEIIDNLRAMQFDKEVTFVVLYCDDQSGSIRTKGILIKKGNSASEYLR
ncbi:MAG: hypothetical protein ACOX63_03365 [Christensenellales bacterium]